MKKIYEIDGAWYHGGSLSSIQRIADSQISTELGGGELGQGFYVGNYGHVASAWARHVAKNEKPSVVALNVDGFLDASLTKRELSWLRAKEVMLEVAKTGARRTHRLAVDVVAAPIVGRNFIDTPSQLKWEGKRSEVFLNSENVGKNITKLV